MTAKDFALWVCNEMKNDRTALFNLVVENLAFQEALKQSLPNFDFPQHLQIASSSPQAHVALQRIRGIEDVALRIQEEGILR